MATNSDMRLVIAGAGGRMGRTLIHAIAVTKGVTLAGAVEARRDRPRCGRTRGSRGAYQGGQRSRAALLKSADGLIEYTIPAATPGHADGGR